MIFIALPAWSARELVDDFSGTTMDFPKWSGFDSADDITEYFVGVNVAVGGKIANETLVLINVGDGSALFRHQKSRAVLRNPKLSAMEATISVVSVEDGGSQAAASLEGQYYNTLSAAPTNQDGDVFATVSIGDRGNGLEAWWEIHVSTHPTFETWNETSGTIIGPAGNLSLDTPYVARIEYNGTQTFDFTVNDTSATRSGPVNRGSPYFTNQSLSTTIRCCDASPAIHATFDDVSIGNPLLLIDSFSVGPYLDQVPWANNSSAVVLSSRVDPAVDGKLFMYVSDGDMLRDGKAGTDLYLRERNPDRIEALVSISSDDSFLEPGILGHARLNGYAYNERRDGGIMALPYDGCDGDVWVQVEIQMQNGALFATAFAGSELSNCDTDEVLIDKDFTKPLAFDTEYLLWIERDGDRLQLGLDDEMVEHSITTQIYPPSPAAGNGFRRISSRIQGTPTSDVDGANGVFAMLVDNVYIASNDEDGNGEGDSSSSDCFIATAAYGSYLAPQVLRLRKFRDQHLLTNPVGAWLVEFYYRHSPPIADYIRDRETLRAVVRSSLALVVYSIEYPIAAGLILVLPPLILVRYRRRRKNSIRLL